MSSNTGPHILVFPYPAQGHMLSLVDLTHKLVLQNVAVTIVITPKNLPFLAPLLAAHPSIQTLVLPFPHHPAIPQGIENVRYLGNKGNIPIMGTLTKLHDPIFEWFQSHTDPPVAILSDFFLGWTTNLARDLGIPRIVFYSSGAFCASLLEHCWRNLEKVRSLDVVELPELPGSPLFREEHLPTFIHFYEESDPDWALVREGMVANTSSWGCVFNSLYDLEGPYIEYLKKRMGHGRVYGVGPLENFGESKQESAGSSEVLTWLDECPDGSVVYVCFGSQTFLNNDQMEALAMGLEKSEIRFVWVVNSGTGMTHRTDVGYGLVPDGFEERLGNRGIVVNGWAPQVLILNHRALGGFLSHCGWNSVLEGIMAGVMILAWPMDADQFVNARLVEEMGAAVRICEGAYAVPDSNEFARIVADSLCTGSVQKERAKEFKQKAIAAVKEDGSSLKDLNMLVKELRHLQTRNILIKAETDAEPEAEATVGTLVTYGGTFFPSLLVPYFYFAYIFVSCISRFQTGLGLYSM